MDYIKRMEVELEELNEKVVSGKGFLASEVSKELLDVNQRDLLATQLFYMEKYEFILKMRIANEKRREK